MLWFSKNHKSISAIEDVNHSLGLGKLFRCFKCGYDHLHEKGLLDKSVIHHFQGNWEFTQLRTGQSENETHLFLSEDPGASSTLTRREGGDIDCCKSQR